MQSITNALGIGSGIDTVALVDQLAAAARAPKDAAVNRQDSLNRARISAIASTTSAVNTFADALASLFADRGFAPVPSSSVAGVATANLLPGARPPAASMTISVQQRASALTRSSATVASANAPNGQGGLTLTGPAGTAAITIGTSSDSLAGLAAAITAADVGVTARVRTDADGARLILAGRDGADGGYTLTADAGAAPDLAALVGGFTTIRPAADALVTVDGAPLRFASNRIDTLLPGVRVDLVSVGTTQVDLVPAERGVRDLLTEFVSAYNSLRSALNNATAPGLDGAAGGPLAGDSRVRATMRALAQVTLTPLATGGASPATLADLGIRTLRDGTLALDTARFDRVNAADPDAVRALIDPQSPGADRPGITGLLDTIRDRLVARDGPLSSATADYTAFAKRLTATRARIDDADGRLRGQLERQFGGMERQLIGLRATQSYLEQQIAAWNSRTNG